MWETEGVKQEGKRREGKEGKGKGMRKASKSTQKPKRQSGRERGKREDGKKGTWSSPPFPTSSLSYLFFASFFPHFLFSPGENLKRKATTSKVHPHRLEI